MRECTPAHGGETRRWRWPGARRPSTARRCRTRRRAGAGAARRTTPRWGRGARPPSVLACSCRSPVALRCPPRPAPAPAPPAAAAPAGRARPGRASPAAHRLPRIRAVFFSILRKNFSHEHEPQTVDRDPARVGRWTRGGSEAPPSDRRAAPGPLGRRTSAPLSSQVPRAVRCGRARRQRRAAPPSPPSLRAGVCVNLLHYRGEARLRRG